jgi:hypothetical protein
MQCGRQPGGKNAKKFGLCPAAIDPTFNGFNRGSHAGRICWLVAGTFCHAQVQGTFAEKQSSCKQCAFYKKVHAEEGTTLQSAGKVNIFAATHIGRVRKANEDRFLIKKLEDDSVLVAVADGVGGEIGGDYAAETMVSVLNTAPDLESKAGSLIQAALDAGGKDNITIVLAGKNT